MRQPIEFFMLLLQLDIPHTSLMIQSLRLKVTVVIMTLILQSSESTGSAAFWHFRYIIVYIVLRYKTAHFTLQMYILCRFSKYRDCSNCRSVLLVLKLSSTCTRNENGICTMGELNSLFGKLFAIFLITNKY